MQQKLEKDFLVKQQEVQNEEFMEKQPIPFVPLLIMLASAYAYGIISRYAMLGAAVPFINVFVLLGALALGVYGSVLGDRL